MHPNNRDLGNLGNCSEGSKAHGDYPRGGLNPSKKGRARIRSPSQVEVGASDRSSDYEALANTGGPTRLRSARQAARLAAAEAVLLATMKRRWAVLIVIATVGAFTLILLQATKRPHSPSVSFLGYTNQNGTTLANFKVQNGNRGTVTVCADIVLWNRAQGRPPPQGGPPKNGPWVISVKMLRSRESTVVQLAPPTNGAPWQTTFELMWHGTLWSQFWNMWGDFFQPSYQERFIRLKTEAIPAYQTGASER